MHYVYAIKTTRAAGAVSRVFNDLPGSQNYKSPSGLPTPPPAGRSERIQYRRERTVERGTRHGHERKRGRRRSRVASPGHLPRPYPWRPYHYASPCRRIWNYCPFPSSPRAAPPARTRAPHTAPYTNFRRPSAYTLSSTAVGCTVRDAALDTDFEGKSEKTATGTVAGSVSLTPPFFFSIFFRTILYYVVGYRTQQWLAATFFL